MSVRLRALIVLTAATLGPLGLALRSSADTFLNPPTGTIQQPAQDGATVTATPVSFSGQFTQPGGVMDSIDLSVTSAEGHPGGAVHLPASQHPPSTTQSFAWQLDLVYNGKYSLAATGSGHDVPPDSFGQQQATVTRMFFVSAAPSAPTGLAASANDDRTVSLSWTANPEPDLVGYIIDRRNPGSGSFNQIGNAGPSATSFVDSAVAALAPGDYSYELVAVRPSGDGRSAVLSNPSASTSVTILGQPSTTTAPTTTTPGPTTTAAGAPGSSSGAKSSTTTAPGHQPAPSLPSPVRSDAGDFGALLAQARASTATTSTTLPPDPGFKTKLPFTPRSSTQAVDVLGGQRASGLSLGEDAGQRRRLTFEYIAGSLILLMLAMHALYLRSQVLRASALEPLEPQTPEE